MEILIPARPGHAGLRIFQPERGPDGALDYFTVEVTGDSLKATARVYAYHSESLVTLFDAMAQQWRGWAGAKEWGSIEGEFSLSCTSDALGHIDLAASLAPSLDRFQWKVDAIAALDAGQLEAIARDVREFIGGSRSAA